MNFLLFGGLLMAGGALLFSTDGSDNSDDSDGDSGIDNVITGDDRSNYLSGDDLNDSISGLGGDDYLVGNGGHDVISGGEGDDSVFGRDGDDRLSGQDGEDLIVAGNGNDQIWGGGNFDVLAGGEGNDSISGGLGQDFLHGEEGNDTLSGGYGDDGLLGGSGADSIEGGNGDDLLHGGGIRFVDDWEDVADDIRSGLDPTDISGPDSGFTNDDLAADTLSGGEGDDILVAGSGDVLIGGAGADLFAVGDWMDEEDAAVIRDLEADDVIAYYYEQDPLNPLADIPSLSSNTVLESDGTRTSTIFVDGVSTVIIENVPEGFSPLTQFELRGVTTTCAAL